MCLAPRRIRKNVWGATGFSISALNPSIGMIPRQLGTIVDVYILPHAKRRLSTYIERGAMFHRKFVQYDSKYENIEFWRIL